MMIRKAHTEKNFYKEHFATAGNNDPFVRSVIIGDTRSEDLAIMWNRLWTLGKHYDKIMDLKWTPSGGHSKVNVSIHPYPVDDSFIQFVISKIGKEDFTDDYKDSYWFLFEMDGDTYFYEWNQHEGMSIGLKVKDQNDTWDHSNTINGKKLLKFMKELYKTIY